MEVLLELLLGIIWVGQGGDVYADHGGLFLCRQWEFQHHVPVVYFPGETGQFLDQVIPCTEGERRHLDFLIFLVVATAGMGYPPGVEGCPGFSSPLLRLRR